MNFRTLPIQPAAGAAGVVSRVQLPAAGRIALVYLALHSGKILPPSPTTDGRNRQREGRAWYRTQYWAAGLGKFN